MITELGLIGLGTYMYNYLNTMEERKFKNNFNEIMLKTGIKNKDDETFKIWKIEKVNYGFICYLNNQKGLSVEHLESKLNIIESNLNSIIQIQKDRFENHIKMYVVDKDISKFKFLPVKAYSDQLWIGKDVKGQDYFISLSKDPHVLIGGCTGSGKSFLLASILTNLISNSSKDIEMYLLQICKSEISAFENCSCVNGTAYTEVECIEYVNKLCEILEERAELFKQHGIRNITQWNTHFKTKRIKRVICVIEELSFFMDKPEIWESIMKLAKAGRSVGIHIISCIQRSTATNLPPDLKSQMTRITFRQKSYIDSVNIINTADACKLKERECIVDANSDYAMVKTPWVDEDYILLNRYVKEISIPTAEEKQEIINIKKENDRILIIEEPEIVDIEEKDVQVLGIKGTTPQSKAVKKKKGVISLEDFKDAYKKR